MKVYVVEQGWHDEQFVAGVYSTKEKAMEAYPGDEWKKDDFSGGWDNGLSWDDALHITEFELDPEKESPAPAGPQTEKENGEQ